MAVAFPLCPPELTRLDVPTVEVDYHSHGRIPAGIADLADFRAWALSDDFLTRARVSYFGGTIWVDLSLEQAYTHNQVKAGVAEFCRIDARGDLKFEILMLAENGYAVAAADDDGWLASPTFGHSFRLRTTTDGFGLPQYHLESRP